MREQTLAVRRMQDYIEQNKTMEITLSDKNRAHSSQIRSGWHSSIIV